MRPRTEAAGVCGKSVRGYAYRNTALELPVSRAVQNVERLSVKVATPAIPLEDLDLVEQSRQGDVAAYGRLVTKYQDRVFNTCMRLCGNRADAEDCTQEAFLKALRAIHSFEGQSQFSTWVFRIAVNVVLSAKRQSRSRPTVSMDSLPRHREAGEAASLAALMASAEQGPEERVDREDTMAEVQRALGSLDVEHRTVIVLRDMESFDYAEIADILGVPKGTVKSRLHRARMALREKLSPLLRPE